MARDLLKGQLEQIVEGSGVTVGLPDLRAGRSVQIEKIGYRLSGKFFVKETSHVFSEQGYRTTLGAAGRGEREGMSDRIFGIVVGIVKDIEDPEGQGRVLLDLEFMPGQHETHWAPWPLPWRVSIGGAG